MLGHWLHFHHPSQAEHFNLSVSRGYEIFHQKKKKKKEKKKKDIPSSQVVKILFFQCWGHVFNPCLGNWDPMCHVAKNNKASLSHPISTNTAWKEIMRDLYWEETKILNVTTLIPEGDRIQGREEWIKTQDWPQLSNLWVSVLGIWFST